MTEPITPQDVASRKAAFIPDEAIEAVNDCIAERYRGGEAVVTQEAIICAMLRLGLDRRAIHENNWLDFEPIYEAAGWEVEYESPGYNESGEATFTFRKKGK